MHYDEEIHNRLYYLRTRRTHSLLFSNSVDGCTILRRRRSVRSEFWHGRDYGRRTWHLYTVDKITFGMMRSAVFSTLRGFRFRAPTAKAVVEAWGVRRA